MEIRITKQIDEFEILHSILCDGLHYFPGYGFKLEYSEDEYQAAKSKLESPCIEDVQVQMIKDGGKLLFNDVESEGEYTRELTHQSLIRGIHQACIVNSELLDRVRNEEYDAADVDCLLQIILFDEIIFE